jgi:hypothetical protein
MIKIDKTLVLLGYVKEITYIKNSLIESVKVRFKMPEMLLLTNAKGDQLWGIDNICFKNYDKKMSRQKIYIDIPKMKELGSIQRIFYKSKKQIYEHDFKVNNKIFLSTDAEMFAIKNKKLKNIYDETRGLIS